MRAKDVLHNIICVKIGRAYKSQYKIILNILSPKCQIYLKKKMNLICTDINNLYNANYG